MIRFVVIFILFFLLHTINATGLELNYSNQQKFYLIVTADDLCLSHGVTQGIVDAHRNGIVTTTSALMNYPNAVETVKRVHAENPNLAIGLHLNITSGKPVLPPHRVPTLIDKNGNFYRADKIVKQLSKISLDEVKAETLAQLELFLSTDVPLDHINSENHIFALYTPLHKVVREIALAQDVPVRNPVPASVHKIIKVKMVAVQKRVHER